MEILAEEFPTAILKGTATTEETLENLRRESWTILILDLYLPTGNGLEVLGEARRAYPKLPVLVLSSAPEEQIALLVLKSGARGYLSKQSAPEFLPIAVRKLMDGGNYVSPAIAKRLAEEAVQFSPLPHETLTEREFQVMQMVMLGTSLKEIASILGLSAKTVSTFHTRIWEKLGVKNDVELVHYAVREHLLEGPLSIPNDF